MKYTSAFSSTIKSQGVPHLNSDQLQRMMNIVFLESYISALEGFSLNSISIFQDINSKKNRLERLTKSLTPDDLLIEMVNLSR